MESVVQRARRGFVVVENSDGARLVATTKAKANSGDIKQWWMSGFERHSGPEVSGVVEW
jgi:hypothetical protein